MKGLQTLKNKRNARSQNIRKVLPSLTLAVNSHLSLMTYPHQENIHLISRHSALHTQNSLIV